MKTDAENLQKWLMTLTLGEYKSVIDRIIEKCMINKHTFQNWRYGNCKVPPLAKPIIEEIAGKKIFKEQKNG
jgi:hypothetical protein